MQLKIYYTSSMAGKSYNAAASLACSGSLIKQLAISDNCKTVNITTDTGTRTLKLSETTAPVPDDSTISIEVEAGSTYLTCKVARLNAKLKAELIIRLNTLLKRRWQLRDQDTTVPYAIRKQDERNLSTMASALSTHCKMGGIEMRRHYPELNFVSQQPEIEMCDIMDFLKSVDNKRVKPYETVVYVNICMNLKYYVGIAKVDDSNEDKYRAAAMSRLKSHRNNGGCDGCPTNWTWINPVTSTLIFLKGDYIDENLVTQLLAKCVGDDHVRGGAWTGIHDTPLFPIMSVDEIKNAILNNC